MTLAATGIVPSASERARRGGSKSARPSCCRILISHRLHAAGQDRRNRSPKQTKVYGLLFTAAAETLTTIAADTKHPGADIGVGWTVVWSAPDGLVAIRTRRPWC